MSRAYKGTALITALNNQALKLTLAWPATGPDAMLKATGRAGIAADLPQSVLAVILHYVPQQQRLSQCALVCQAWAAAAVQATIHVQRKLRLCKLPALHSWMALYAGQLWSLDLSVSCKCEYRLLLPLQQLTQLRYLQLDGITLQLPGSEDTLGAAKKGSILESDSSKGNSSKGNSGKRKGSKGKRSKDRGKKQGSSTSSGSEDSSLAASPVLSSLRHLKLASFSSLLQLTKAPQLSCLMLKDITLVDSKFCSDLEHSNSPRGVSRVANALPRLLQQLPQLSVLELPGFPFTDAAVQQAAAMTRLQQLTIEQRANKAPCNLDHLPSSITQLHLYGNWPGSDPSIPLEWPQMSGLRDLELRECAVYLEVLRDFTQLQRLQLLGCRLLPCDPNARYESVGTAALFEALPRLSCLKELYLDLDRLDLSIDPQQFSVLTASSQLTSLDLFRDDAMPIPQKALQHMLPPGQQLQFLEELTISATPGENKYFDVDAWCLNSADLLRIAEACPRLRWLRIINTVQPGADLSPLLQLSRSCTILEVGGQAFTDAAVPLLLQLTQLEDLSWNQSPRFTDVGLEQLTRLDLTQLLIGKCGLSYQVCPYNSSLVLKQDPMLGFVKQQLDELCDRSLMCGPARIRKLRERRRDAEQRVHAAAEREQDLQGRLYSSAAEIRQLRQQLEAARAAGRYE